jgi:membrane protease YdiL (CAAX protease family)
MIDLIDFSFLAIAIIAVPLSLLLWALAVDRVLHRRPMIAWSSRRSVPWTILDLLMIMVLFIVVVSIPPLAIAAYYGLPVEQLQMDDPNLAAGQRVALVAGFSFSSLLHWLVALYWMHGHAGAQREDLGWLPTHRAADLRLGFVAFLMLVVPMLGIHYVALQAFPSDEIHPFIDIVLENPRPKYLVPIVLAAVGVAPLVEEFLFRVFLQGWLERFAFRRNTQNSEIVDAELVTSEDLGTSCAGQADAADCRPLEAVEAPHAGPADRSRRTCWWPIVASALVFSLSHTGQGPAPIPLFFLGLGLGYVYQRTHRVLPCVVIHFLVNATAVVQLAVYIAQQNGMP